MTFLCSSTEKVTVKIKIEEWHYNNDYSASDDSFLSENLSKIENEKNNITEMVESYQKKLEDIQDSNSEIAKNINKFKEDSAKQMEILSNEYEKQIEEILNQQKLLDENQKAKEETERKELAKLQAELSVIQQNKEIIDNKIGQMKDLNQNEKIEHDKYIKILEENNKELLDKYENISKENNMLKNAHSNELNELNKKNDLKEKEFLDLNENLKNELNQLLNENETKVKELRNKVKNNQNNVIPKMKQKISDLQNEKENLAQDIEFCGKTHKHKLAEIALEYEDEKEKILTNNRQLLEDDNNENDQQIQEIRKIFQIEKDKISEEMKKENLEAQEKINKIEIPYIKNPSDKKYTLILDLNKTLAFFDKSSKSISLRNGLFSFLSMLKPYYEIISFSCEPNEVTESIIKDIESQKIYFDYNLTYKTTDNKKIRRF